MVIVINISEIDTAKVFQIREFLLGNNAGNWFVVDDNVYLGRYVDKTDAQEHANSLNNRPYDDRPIEELITDAEEVLRKIEIGEYD